MEKEIQIGDVCEVRMGHAFRTSLEHVPDGSIAVIQPKNISSTGLLTFGEDEPWRTDVSASTFLEDGDVLLVNRGRFAAAVFRMHAGENYIVPSSVLVLTLTSQALLPEYLALYLNSPGGQKLFRRHAETSTVPFIRGRNLARAKIPIPGLDRQRALTEWEAVSRRYACLTARKIELHRSVLTHELTEGDHAMRGSRR